MNGQTSPWRLPPAAVALSELIRAMAAPTLAATTRPTSPDRVALRAVDGLISGGTPELPKPIIDWLAHAILLHGVPFEYIVPDGRLLPKEAIRFFYVDINWQRRLIDGAVSVGLSSSADEIATMAAIESAVEQALRATARVRPAQRGAAALAAANDDETVGPITGLLLRSAAVSGWPGIEITAYANENATGALRPLRIDRVADDVLICVFDGLPERVDFLQPPEALRFGVRPNAGTYITFLRGLGYGAYTGPGVQIPDVQATLTMRGGTAKPGVLDVAASALTVGEKLKALNALDPANTFTAAEFAVQMVRAAGMQPFLWSVPEPSADADANGTE
jgi:hypothetical protein